MCNNLKMTFINDMIIGCGFDLFNYILQISFSLFLLKTKKKTAELLRI